MKPSFASRSPLRRSLAVAALAVAAAAALAPRQTRGADYRQDYATLDGGGGRATSPRYSHAGSFGGLGGTPSTASHATLRPGFLGQLNDPPIPGPDLLHRPVGLGAKTPVADLLENDLEPEGGPLLLVAIDPTGEAGGTVAVDGGWALYEPPSTPAADDRFRYLVADAEGDLALVTVDVSTLSPNPQATRNLLAITPLPGGEVRIDFIGIPLRRYRLEWTDDVLTPDWHELGRIDAGPQGLFAFTDHPEGAARFYRAVAD